MSFLSELSKKKKELKHVETVLTDFSGKKVMGTMDVNGTIVPMKVFQGMGFVVDNKPDLQVACILNYLFLGSQDSAQNGNFLLKNGITHILSVGIDLPASDYLLNFQIKKIELLDVPEAHLADALNASFEFIEMVRRENANHKIFVHCNAGYSRSPAIVIGYLMRAFRYTLAEALALVNEKRKVKPNNGFLQQLQAFENELNDANNNVCSFKI